MQNITIKEIAKLVGVSKRTLHYYDEIGLLSPADTTEAGYRLYSDKDLERLQQIMFFKELGFELKLIKEILSSSSFDKKEALTHHRKILLLKKNRIENLINLVDKTLEGERIMSFKEFDMTEINEAQEKYKAEVEERWGSSEAYAESVKKTAKYSKEDWAKITVEAEDIYKALVANMDKLPESTETQALIEQWQEHITKYYYKCTKEILAGLGQMYVADKRFKKNIDKYGQGLADYMSKAIKIYCS